MEEVFYLYKCHCCNHMFISDKAVKGAMQIDSTQARFWIEAKEKLGFPLTLIQNEIMKETK